MDHLAATTTVPAATAQTEVTAQAVVDVRYVALPVTPHTDLQVGIITAQAATVLMGQAGLMVLLAVTTTVPAATVQVVHTAQADRTDPAVDDEFDCFVDKQISESVKLQ